MGNIRTPHTNYIYFSRLNWYAHYKHKNRKLRHQQCCRLRPFYQGLFYLRANVHDNGPLGTGGTNWGKF